MSVPDVAVARVALFLLCIALSHPAHTLQSPAWFVEAVGDNATASSLASGLTDPVSLSGGGDYYVAPGGNDSNPGTEQQPFATLQRCVDGIFAQAAGGSCRVRAGIYRESIQIPATAPGTQSYSPKVILGEAGVVVTGLDVLEGGYHASITAVRLCIVSLVSLFLPDLNLLSLSTVSTSPRFRRFLFCFPQPHSNPMQHDHPVDPRRRR